LTLATVQQRISNRQCGLKRTPCKPSACRTGPCSPPASPRPLGTAQPCTFLAATSALRACASGLPPSSVLGLAARVAAVTAWACSWASSAKWRMGRGGGGSGQMSLLGAWSWISSAKWRMVGEGGGVQGRCHCLGPGRGSHLQNRWGGAAAQADVHPSPCADRAVGVGTAASKAPRYLPASFWRPASMRCCLAASACRSCWAAAVLAACRDCFSEPTSCCLTCM
jgi:hypothetical protein